MELGTKIVPSLAGEDLVILVSGANWNDNSLRSTSNVEIKYVLCIELLNYVIKYHCLNYLSLKYHCLNFMHQFRLKFW